LDSYEIYFELVGGRVGYPVCTVCSGQNLQLPAVLSSVGEAATHRPIGQTTLARASASFPDPSQCCSHCRRSILFSPIRHPYISRRPT